MIKDIIGRNAEAAAGQKEIKVLREYFPQCFNADGEFDIEAFKAALPEGTTLTDETSGFNWLGKNYARMLTNMDTTTLIRPDEEHNAKPENRDSQNVYISGDNLDALQHLVKSYGGKVKVIYIDPPYNTGSDGFVYNDKFNFTADDLAKRLDVSRERAERILSMTRRGSASHAAWLTFMLPRLSFARDLLTDDGVIFISIDDNEQANLKKLCDEVFSEECFVAQFIWEKRKTRENRASISIRHDYVLCYVKDIELLEDSLGLEMMTKAALSRYKNPDNDPKGPWTSVPAIAQAGHGTKSQFYTFVAPNGKSYNLPSGSCWRMTLEKMNEAVAQNKIWFGSDGNGVPRIKKYLSEGKQGLTPESIISSEKGGTNDSAKREIVELFNGKAVFETPKPVELIRHILSMTLGENITVLDFFGGSSTTAHAVMQKNAEDGGNRKFILVQWQEECKPDSEAAKAGYKTIDEVGIERIKRAAKKIKEANPLFAGDLGFKHFVLEEPKENALLQMETFDPITTISSLTVDDFGLEAVLRTWLVADGYGFTEDAEEMMLGRYKAYWKDNHLYMINPDNDFDANSIAALMDKYNGEPFSPQNIVIFGYSFSFTHCEELQKNLRTLKEGNKTLTVNIDVRY
ncbi:site-specific DNA-methyltransferase [Leyella stercorea]|uniref:site-specific DNA-methyltransferase n=1 Tax=Leyella stercorea TaxID=363265 RepID=UPI0024319740|nr:site-specific DNA-methyltransferase [Leyella stercorea]